MKGVRVFLSVLSVLSATPSVGDSCWSITQVRKQPNEKPFTFTTLTNGSKMRMNFAPQVFALFDGKDLYSCVKTPKEWMCELGLGTSGMSMANVAGGLGLKTKIQTVKVTDLRKSEIIQGQFCRHIKVDSSVDMKGFFGNSTSKVSETGCYTKGAGLGKVISRMGERARLMEKDLVAPAAVSEYRKSGSYGYSLKTATTVNGKQTGTLETNSIKRVSCNAADFVLPPHKSMMKELEKLMKPKSMAKTQVKPQAKARAKTHAEDAIKNVAKSLLSF